MRPEGERFCGPGAAARRLVRGAAATRDAPHKTSRGEGKMKVPCRKALSGALAPLCLCLGLAMPTNAADAPKVIKISHQFPASQGDEGDFRDRLSRKFVAEVEKRTHGQLTFEVYPGNSLMRSE